MSRWGVTAPPRVALLFKSRRVIPSKPLSCTSPSLHQSIHPSIHQSINNQSIEQNRIHRNQTNQEKKNFKIRSWIQTHHFILLLFIVSNGAVDSDFDIAKHSAVGSSVQRGSRFGSRVCEEGPYSHSYTHKYS